MTEVQKLTDFFWINLAKLLSEKILKVFPDFDEKFFISLVKNDYKEKT